MSTATNWTGLFKRRYGPFANPTPPTNTLAEHCKFVEQEMRDGEDYAFPVLTGIEHGVTHAKQHDAFSLNASIDSTTERAFLSGCEIALRGTLPYGVVARAKNGIANGGGAGGAYFDAFDLKIKMLMEGGEFYREIALAYGAGTGAAAAANIGVVSDNVTASDLDPGCTLSITKASWAPMLWAKMKNALVDIYQSDGSTVRAAGVTVTGITLSNNSIALTLTGSAVTPAANDIIVPRTALTKSCYGLQAILENSGSLFNISAATNPAWKATSFAVSGALARTKIFQLMARLAVTGVKNGGKLFVNPNAFADLCEEGSGLQRFTTESTTKTQGAQTLKYQTPCGVVEVVSYAFMKQGIAFFLPNGAPPGSNTDANTWASNGGPVRVGSTDLTFNLGKNEWFFNELSGTAGSEMRIYSDQAVVCPMPWQCAILTGIVSTGDTAPAAP